MTHLYPYSSNQYSNTSINPISGTRRIEPQFLSGTTQAKESTLERTPSENSLKETVTNASRLWVHDDGSPVRNKVNEVISVLVLSKMFDRDTQSAEVSDEVENSQSIQTKSVNEEKNIHVVSADENVTENIVQTNPHTVKTEDSEVKSVVVNSDETVASALLKAYPQVGTDEMSIPSKGRILYSFIYQNYDVLSRLYNNSSKKLPSIEKLGVLYKESLRENKDALYELIEIVNQAGSVRVGSQISIQTPSPRDMLDIDINLKRAAETDVNDSSVSEDRKKSFWNSLFGGA